MRRLLAFACAAMLVAGPALAQSAAVRGTVVESTPAPFATVRPIEDRGAYISQIGDENDARVTQDNERHYARIEQNGERNHAAVTQSGTDHYARVSQALDDNGLTLDQSGAGTQVALLVQNGHGNRMEMIQDGGGLGNGVEAMQFGDRNTMTLAQNGSDNQAQLTQNGSDNTMNPVQNGDGNRLVWAQNGSGLADLGVTQSGGQAIQITQSN